MRNFYFVGAPSLAKGIEEFNLLAEFTPQARFHWFSYKVERHDREKYRNIHFVVGLGDYELRKRISEEMNIFVSCSQFEGFCLPVAEAMLLRKPVITYRLEEIESEFGDTIEYVECFKFERLRKRIAAMSTTPDYKKSLGLAKKYIETNYSYEQVAKRLLESIN